MRQRIFTPPGDGASSLRSTGKATAMPKSIFPLYPKDRLAALASANALRAIREGLLWTMPCLLVSALFLLLSVCARQLDLPDGIATLLASLHRKLSGIMPLMAGMSIGYMLSIRHRLHSGGMTMTAPLKFKPSGRPKGPPSEVRIDGNTAYVSLSNGLVAVIDAVDVALVSGHRWHVVPGKSTNYAARQKTTNRRQKTFSMHREILGGHCMVDHVDGNGLNNRRANLRPATPAQNAQNARRRSDNTSGLKGASRQGIYWQARISSGGKAIYLGLFKTAEEAHAAYCSASKNLHGEFGRMS